MRSNSDDANDDSSSNNKNNKKVNEESLDLPFISGLTFEEAEV